MLGVTKTSSVVHKVYLTMNEKEEREKQTIEGENKEKTEKKTDAPVVSEELVRWMTEGTSPHHIPRSDCG